MTPAKTRSTAIRAIGDENLPDLIEDLLARGTRVRLGVGGVSMAPHLHDHDHVIIELLTERPAHFGDLVLFRNSSGALVLHRVVRT